MNENYIVINGKKSELTAEQIKALGIEVRKNPFERAAKNEEYYCIKETGEIDAYYDNSSFDDRVYNNANYFNDKRFANQVALRQLLDRKLLKYAYDNGYESTEEPNQYYINYFPKTKSYMVQIDFGFRAFCTHFSSYKAAECAIKEVVEPFVKEHPEFVW